MIDIQALNWQTLTPEMQIPTTVVNWLIDTKSLTAKLKDKYADFGVKVISQASQSPYTHEQALLGEVKTAVVREVELIGNQQVVVFARSVIPQTADTQPLLEIGSKPLGEVLFNDPNIARGPLQITQANGIWGRRSTFVIGDTPILVSEFFLEGLYA